MLIQKKWLIRSGKLTWLAEKWTRIEDVYFLLNLMYFVYCHVCFLPECNYKKCGYSRIVLKKLLSKVLHMGFFYTVGRRPKNLKLKMLRIS